MAYALGDPIQFMDRGGSIACDPDVCGGDGSGGDSGVDCDAYPDAPGCALTLSEASASNPNSPCYGNSFVANGYEPCPSAGDESDEEPRPACPPKYQAWIDAHGADALAAGLPEANALALTSIESSWGNGRFAKDGNDFFNLETCWSSGTPFPATKYAYQTGWMQAGSPSDSCGKGLHYALVATYGSSLDSFKSAAAKFANLQAADPTTFAANAVTDGIFAGRGPAFLKRQKVFADCLSQ